MKKVNFLRDEMPHSDEAIEWWYFNGFVKGKKEYAFMNCLFRAEREKVNLGFLKVPFKTVYFSHSMLFDLKNKRVDKEVLPMVVVSADSFTKEELMVNYFYPLRKHFFNYEIARNNSLIRLKTRFLDLTMEEKKKPMLVGGNGFIKLKNKSTYYYSYPDLNVRGYVGKEKVTGTAWHDRQWSDFSSMKDSWVWFSLKFNNTEIVCFDYKGEKFATISYPNGKQETLKPEFVQLGNKWKSNITGFSYVLDWKIKIGRFNIITKPLMKECEMCFGSINYWEGPIEVFVNGLRGKGFMEYLAEPTKFDLKDVFKGEILKRMHLFG